MISGLRNVMQRHALNCGKLWAKKLRQKKGNWQSWIVSSDEKCGVLQVCVNNPDANSISLTPMCKNGKVQYVVAHGLDLTQFTEYAMCMATLDEKFAKSTLYCEEQQTQP